MFYGLIWSGTINTFKMHDLFRVGNGYAVFIRVNSIDLYLVQLSTFEKHCNSSERLNIHVKTNYKNTYYLFYFAYAHFIPI